MTTYLFDRSRQQGRLELMGRDRLDLLHRMSTNDMLNMKPREGRSTVLTTALARIIDRVIVYHRGETALMIANQPETVRAWLQKHIFFRDDVKLRNVSAELGQLELHGPQAATIVRELVDVDVSGLALHQFVEHPLNNSEDDLLFVTCTLSLTNSGGFILIAPAKVLDQLRESILKHNAVMGDEATYETLRVQAGLPGPGHELTETYIPLEAGLWDSVSFTKGCYIGQEIIARMESRNKLAKTLVKLNISQGVPVGARLVDGEGRNVGTLTSVARIEDGRVIGLGFVKPDNAEPGSQLLVVGEESTNLTVAAEVVAAPLLSTRRQEV
jgi:folate-binding protein YgfZ